MKWLYDQPYSMLEQIAQNYLVDIPVVSGPLSVVNDKDRPIPMLEMWVSYLTFGDTGHDEGKFKRDSAPWP